MKTLYVHRHAKSDWESGASSDHERPLNSRGSKDAPKMAKLFALSGPHIDLLLSSTALRARSTMHFYEEALSLPKERIALDQGIYHGNVDSLMDILEELPDNADHVMIFGHNPTFTDLCQHLDHSFTGYLCTSARVKLELDIDSWKEICSGCGSCAEHVFPKMYH